MHIRKNSVLIAGIAIVVAGDWYVRVYLPEKKVQEFRLRAKMEEEQEYAAAITVGSIEAALHYVAAFPHSKRFDEQYWEGLMRREVEKEKSPERLLSLITDPAGVITMVGKDSMQRVCMKLTTELVDASFPDNQAALDSFEQMEERRLALEKQCAFVEKVKAATFIASSDLKRTLRGRFARIASNLPMPINDSQALKMEVAIQAMPRDSSDTQRLARQMADYFEADFLKTGKMETLQRFEAITKLVTFTIPSHDLLMKYATARQQGVDQIARFINEANVNGNKEDVKQGRLLEIATTHCECLLRPAVRAYYEPLVKTFTRECEPWIKDVLAPAKARCEELKSKLEALRSGRTTEGNAPLGFPLFTNDAKSAVTFVFRRESSRFKLPPIEFPKVIDGTLLFLGIPPNKERQLSTVEDEALKQLFAQLPEQFRPGVSVDGSTITLSLAGPSEMIAVRADVIVQGGRTVKLQNLLTDLATDLSDACVLNLIESKKAVGYYKSSMGGLSTGIPAERTTVTARLVRLRDRKLVASKSFTADPAERITLNLNGPITINDTDGSEAADRAMKQWLYELIEKASEKSP